MTLAQSRITAQGQVSIPADVRRRLGVGPGSVVRWKEEEGRVVIERVASASFEDVHKSLFPEGPPAKKTLKELKSGIGENIRKRHAGH